MFQGIEGPLVLVVMDGVGEIDATEGNAVKLAHTPYYDQLRETAKFATLRAHGRAVGLPSDKDMGNSEVGHNALGSGQIYDQGAKLVNDAIESGRLFEGETWRKAIDRVAGKATSQATLHLIGLLSDGNVHSHIRHLEAMIDRAANEGVMRLRVHVLLDGRDVDGVSAHRYIEQLEAKLDEHRQAERDFCIAGGGGRMQITMDRYEADWDMVARGWAIHVHGEGRQFPDAMTAVNTFRDENPGVIDQNLPGFVVGKDGEAVGPIEDGDSVLCFNFRGDRAIELSRAFDEDEFDAFDRGRRPDVFYAGMMQYDGDLHLPKHFLVGPPAIRNTLTDLLVKHKVTQYAISETQKFGHVTYFWNGNRSGKVDPSTETYEEIPSDNVSFDERPWMKAAEITDALSAAIRSGDYQFLRANYPNGDMVGHTGDLDAAILAMSCVDLQLKRLFKVVGEAKGVALLTADHGNCDEMIQTAKDGSVQPKTSHTLSPVPLFLYDPHGQVTAELSQDDEQGIANIAATVAELMGLAPPEAWERSLLRWS